MMEGDLYLFDTKDGGEISIRNGVPLIDGGLETATYISIFGGNLWWGNSISEEEEKIDSDFESILDRTLTNQTRLDAIEYIRDALAWMIPAKVARSVSVDAVVSSVSTLAVTIEIVRPDFSAVNRQFEINWDNQLMAPIFESKPKTY